MIKMQVKHISQSLLLKRRNIFGIFLKFSVRASLSVIFVARYSIDNTNYQTPHDISDQP